MPGSSPSAGGSSGLMSSFVRLERKSTARSSAILIWLGAAGLTALFLASVGWSAYQSHGRTIRSAHASIENIALLLEEHTTRTVGAVDMTLQMLLNEEQLQAGTRTGDFSPLMTRLLSRTPHLETVKLLNEETGAVLGTYKSSRELLDDTDWAAMYAHSANSTSHLHIGDPRWNEDDRTWRVGISRRHATPDGRSLIAVAQTSLGKLQRDFNDIKIGEDGAIVLFRSDAMILARRPYVEANVGRYVPKAQLFTERLPKAPHGVYETSGAVDQVERIIAYRQLPNFPLVLLAALSRQEVLAPWWDETLNNLVLLPLAMAFLLAFGFLLSREAKRRARAEAQAFEKTAFLEATLENMDQGLLMVDSDLHVQVCNRRAMELLDLSPELMNARPHFNEVTYRQFQAGEFENAEEAFRQWVAAGGFERIHHVYERERPNGTVLEVRTVPIANGGAVRTFTNITQRKRAESELRAAEAEYRTLFENAVIGIYRSSPDGRQLRANPALVRMNGYASEEQMLAAVNDIGREWYVDPNRREEFVRVMREHGRVTDFVSEIFRHGTRERIWISETAWTVRDLNGELIGFEGTILDATDRKRAEAQIERAARHDVLTDLPNRKLLREQIEEGFEQVAKTGEPFAILCLDLDMFKGVNDTLGHPVGDALLVAVSQRIRQNLRKDDLVARLGGDEFAILQIGTEQPDGAGALAKRIVAAIARPFDIDGHQVSVGASIGIAVAPSDGRDPDQLLKNADLALYKAKNDGRGRLRFFEPAMDLQVQARRSLELDLRQALQNNEVELHYQPLVHVTTGSVVGFEALINWVHPRRGRVAASEFFPVAEETGLILPLGEWALRQACRDGASWPSHMRVSVNISAAQFRSQNIAQIVVSALASSGLSPDRLELEISETVLMANSEISLRALHQLRGLGVRVAMNDFGVGYSSLNLLRGFPFDKIKIDCSLVRDLGSNADGDRVARAIFDLGASLGVATIAEGIETKVQLEFIGAKGCVEAQGFLFGQPQPARRLLQSLGPDEAHVAA